MPLTMAKERARPSPSRRSPAKMKSACIWRGSGFVVDSEVTVVNEIAGNLIRTGQGKPPGTRQDDGESHCDRLNSAARCFGTCSDTGMVSE